MNAAREMRTRNAHSATDAIGRLLLFFCRGGAPTTSEVETARAKLSCANNQERKNVTPKSYSRMRWRTKGR